MKRNILLLLIVFFMVLCLTGCLQTENNSGSEELSKPAPENQAETTDLIFKYLTEVNQDNGSTIHKKIIKALPGIDWKKACEKYNFEKVFNYLSPYISEGDEETIKAFLAARTNLDGITAEGYAFYLKECFLQHPGILVNQLSEIDQKSYQEIIKLLSGELIISGFSLNELEESLSEIKGAKEEEICEDIKGQFSQFLN